MYLIAPKSFTKKFNLYLGDLIGRLTMEVRDSTTMVHTTQK